MMLWDFVTQTCLCNMLQFFMALKTILSRCKSRYFSYFCSKNNILVLTEVVLTVESHQKKIMKTSLRPEKSKDVVRTWSK